jgi:hypothetical protein
LSAGFVAGTPLKCSKPEKFFEGKIYEYFGKTGKSLLNPRKGTKKMQIIDIYLILNISVTLYFGPYDNAKERYFTLKNFFWPAVDTECYPERGYIWL